MRRPRLALVPGEPAGVGAELCVLAAQRSWDANLLVFGDRATLTQAAAALDLPLVFLPPAAAHAAAGELRLVDMPNATPIAFGSPDSRNAQGVISTLIAAADGCLQGELDGLVTGPVHKAVINQGGIAYTGTTELLSNHASTKVVMMLANHKLRVALATTHLPLRAVADAITPDRLTTTLRVLDTALRHDFQIQTPRIAVLGLNPHAGEAGHLGREEIDVIQPVLELLRGEGLQLTGPLPADTAFLPAKLAGFDAVLAMYHDQGLPVLKYSGFEHAVNISLGLPYPRVAVDHGTALELAGKGSADPSSLFTAIETCISMARARKHLQRANAP